MSHGVQTHELKASPQLAIDNMANSLRSVPKPLLAELISSFQSALKDQDLWQAADIVNKMMKFTYNEPTRKVLIDSGVVKCTVKLIGSRYHQRERLMVYCSWLLYNIAAGDHESVQHIVNLGVIKKAIGLLKHPNSEVKQNAVGLLANIAGDSVEFRDLLIEEENIVEHIDWLLNSLAPRPSLLKNVTWLISNLTKEKPCPPDYESVRLLDYSAYFLNNMKDNEVIEHSLSSLDNLSDDNDLLRYMYELDIDSKLIFWAYNNDVSIQARAMRILDNMVIESNDQAEVLIRKGLLKAYSSGLESKKKEIRKDVCRGLSNLLAGDPGLIDQVFEFEDGVFIKKLVEMFSIEDHELVLECLYCFNNVSMVGSVQQIDTLVNYGVIKIMVSRLKTEKDVAMIKLCLETLESILLAYNDPDFWVSKVELIEKLKDCDCYMTIEGLQNHPYYEVCKIVDRLVEFMFDYYTWK